MAERLDEVTEARFRELIRDELAMHGLIQPALTSDTLADQFRKARKAEGLTQVQMAARLDVAQKVIVDIEAGLQRLMIRQLDEMARAFGKRIVLVDLPEPEEVPDARD